MPHFSLLKKQSGLILHLGYLIEQSWTSWKFIIMEYTSASEVFEDFQTWTETARPYKLLRKRLLQAVRDELASASRSLAYRRVWHNLRIKHRNITVSRAKVHVLWMHWMNYIRGVFSHVKSCVDYWILSVPDSQHSSFCLLRGPHHAWGQTKWSLLYWLKCATLWVVVVCRNYSVLAEIVLLLQK